MLRKGDEMVPGYRLEAFLGKGQFGEVWRTTAPGGTSAALKFIQLGGKQGVKEFRGVQRVKEIRHAHLMPITALWLLDENGKVLGDEVLQAFERETRSVAGSQTSRISGTMVASETHVDTVNPEWLVVAMLLGTKNLLDRLEEHHAAGQEGIPVVELLGYMEEAAKGIDFLNMAQHDLGEGVVAIQHCDIKPANMMLIGGSVVICAFGLARMLGEGSFLSTTATGMVGSPAYMAPECINRKPSQATDQYSLAITYAELRTGRLPFAEESYLAVLDAHRKGTHDLSRLPPAEQAVIRKATSVDPAGRYPTSLAMVQALKEAVHGPRESVVVRAPEPQQSYAAIAVALMLALVGVGAVTLIWPWSNVPAPSPFGVTKSESVQLTFRPAATEVRIDEAVQTLDGNGQLTLELAPDRKLRIEATQGEDYAFLPQTFTLDQLRARQFTIELEPTAKSYVKTALQQQADGNWDQAVATYRLAIGRDPSQSRPQPVELGRHKNRVVQLRFSTDGRWLASAGDDGICQVWPAAGFPGQQVPRVLDAERREPLENLAFSVKGDMLATVGWPDVAHVWSLAGDQPGQAHRALPGHSVDVLDVECTSDGRWLITIDSDFVIQLWPLPDKMGPTAESIVLRPEGNGVMAADNNPLLVSADSRWLVARDMDDRLFRWDLSAADIAATRTLLPEAGFHVKAALITPESNELVLAGEQGALVARSISSPEAPSTDLTFGKQAFFSLATSIDGTQLLAGDDDKRLVWWRRGAKGFERVADWGQHLDAIVAVSMTADGQWAVTGSYDKSVLLWHLETVSAKAQPLHLGEHLGQVLTVAIDPTGRWCATADESGLVWLWDLRRCQLIQQATENVPLQPAGKTQA